MITTATSRHTPTRSAPSSKPRRDPSSPIALSRCYYCPCFSPPVFLLLPAFSCPPLGFQDFKFKPLLARSLSLPLVLCAYLASPPDCSNELDFYHFPRSRSGWLSLPHKTCPVEVNPTHAKSQISTLSKTLLRVGQREMKLQRSVLRRKRRTKKEKKRKEKNQWDELLEATALLAEDGMPSGARTLGRVRAAPPCSGTSLSFSWHLFSTAQRNSISRARGVSQSNQEPYLC